MDRAQDEPGPGPLVAVPPLPARSFKLRARTFYRASTACRGSQNSPRVFAFLSIGFVATLRPCAACRSPNL